VSAPRSQSQPAPRRLSVAGIECLRDSFTLLPHARLPTRSAQPREREVDDGVLVGEGAAGAAAGRGGGAPPAQKPQAAGEG
jgi:hypothetical protein